MQGVNHPQIPNLLPLRSCWWGFSCWYPHGPGKTWKRCKNGYFSCVVCWLWAPWLSILPPHPSVN